MENLVILITSGEEEERNGSTCERPVRSKLEEYRQVADLTGFDHLKAMMEAEAFIKVRRRNIVNRRRRRKKNKNKKRNIDLVAHDEVTVGAAKEDSHLGRNEAEEKATVAKADSIDLSKIDLTLNLGHSAKGKEDAGGVQTVEATEAREADDGLKSVQVIDCCSSSSEDNKVISDVSLCRGIADVTEGANINKKKKRNMRKRRKMKMTSANDMVMEDNVIKDNAVLRMLLRKPRYFDPPDSIWVPFSSCCAQSHRAANDTQQKRKKRCFLCGSLEHTWSSCRQAQDCSARKGTDHLADDCPETEQGNNLSSKICLRCGDPGHDMFSCMGGYPADDLKDIQCYMCRRFGHLCCVKFQFMGTKPVACYNCGRLGHLGYVSRLLFSCLLLVNAMPCFNSSLLYFLNVVTYVAMSCHLLCLQLYLYNARWILCQRGHVDKRNAIGAWHCFCKYIKFTVELLTNLIELNPCQACRKSHGNPNGQKSPNLS